MKTVIAIRYGKVWVQSFNAYYGDIVKECNAAQEEREVMYITDDKMGIGRTLCPLKSISKVNDSES